MAELHIRAGERVRILSKNFSSVPGTISFEARAVEGADPPRGQVEVCGSNWIFKKPPSTQPLAATNSADKGFWDTFYSIYVTPEHDVVVNAPGTRRSSLWLLIGIAVGVTAIAGTIMWLATG